MKLRKQKPIPLNRPSKPTNYPSGTAVEADGQVYLIKGKTKFRLFSAACTKSWNFNQILPGTQQSLSKFINGGILGFRDGSLIKNIADGRMYIVSDNKLRHIQTPAVFDAMGFSRDNVIEVSDDESKIQEEGQPIK